MVAWQKNTIAATKRAQGGLTRWGFGLLGIEATAMAARIWLVR